MICEPSLRNPKLGSYVGRDTLVPLLALSLSIDMPATADCLGMYIHGTRTHTA